MSWIVENSVKMGQPIIGIGINYRLNLFGFVSSEEVRETDNSNFGMRDQRLALHWIQKNAAAFGGDPEKVTIFGESAGAAVTILSSINAVANELVEIYSDDSADQVLQNLPPQTEFPAAFGSDFRRVATYAGDQMFIAHRRGSCEAWAKSGTTAFCYRFNAMPMNYGAQRAWMGATHFVEVAFVFLNLAGYGYDDHVPAQQVFDGLSESYEDLARLISGDWVAFTNHGDPNRWSGCESIAATLGVPVPVWPEYRVAGSKCGAPHEVYVYEGNVSCRAERDTYRKEGNDLINSVNQGVFDR